MLIRPEHVRLGPQAQGCRNRFTGRVEESIFQGPIVRTVLRLPSGGRLVAHASPRSGEAWVPGSELVIGWEPDDNVLIAL